MIYVSVDYNVQLSRGEQSLMELPNRLANLRPVMLGAIAPRVQAMLKKHWESKGAAFGHKWAPWSESTARKRAKKGNVASGILVDTGHLFKVLVRDRITDNRLRSVPGGLKLALDTRVPRAVFHQVGTQFMPERQVIPDPLPVSFRREVKDVLRAYVLTGRVQRA